MNQEKLIQLFGAFLLGDDSADIGKFDRLHHWQLGAAMVALPLLLDDEDEE
ncbi:MAG: hypothetical protein ACXAEN_19495 [Candidatus Thorarchaeota archaeon]|jgi:hypothetical protein